MAATLRCVSRRTVLGSAMKRTEPGFTLIELAVVLVIIGTMLTLGIAAFNAQTTSSAYTKTKLKLDVLREALTNHLATRGHLPCPDADLTAPDGRGDDDRNNVGSGTELRDKPCSVAVGLVPYVELELPREAALDGWENFFSFQVAIDRPSQECDGANPAIFDSNKDWTRLHCFFSGNDGNISVVTKDATGATVSSVSNAAVVIVSHGSNGFGARTVKGTLNNLPSVGSDEYTNTAQVATDTFVVRPLTEDTDPGDPASGDPFDDVVLVLQPSQLLSAPKEAKVMLWEYGELGELFAAVRDATRAYVLSHRQPDGTTGCYMYDVPGWSNISADVLQRLPPQKRNVLDPWGSVLAYPSLPAIIRYNPPVGWPTITFGSRGKNRADDSCLTASDDICRVIDVFSLADFPNGHWDTGPGDTCPD